MDTDRNLIKKWKIKRDVIERNHSIERVISQIENRTQDYYQYIHNQRNNADIIVNYHETCDCELKCKLIIKNKDIFDKLSPYFIKFNYSINFLEDEFIIELKNNCDISYNDEKIQQILKNIPPQIYSRNNYYCEILAIISLYIYNSDK
jgi:phosphoribulokinase